MATTLYATFVEIENAERAVGAMLDYGVRPEDVSLIRRQQDSMSVESGTEMESHSAAAYGDDPAMGNSRFGADATGMTDTTGLHGTTDSNGIAGENQVKRGMGVSRANDNEYDNLAARDETEEYDPEKAAKAGLTATTPEDAGAGAVKGAGIGLGLGAVAALVSMFVPGVGLVAGGGALATAIAGLAGTTGAGAIAGAVTGYLKDQGMDSHVAEGYASAIAEGGALVSVAVPSGSVDETTVRSILDKYGVANVTNFAGTGSGGYVA